MIHVIATLKLKPGARTALVAAAIPYIEVVRKEAGCLRYDLLCDVLDEDKVTFVEEWESRELLEPHLHTADGEIWHAASQPLIAEANVMVIYPERTERLAR